MLKDKLIKWTRDYLGEDTKVVLGISGGKDSTIMYALLKEAIGKDRIIPVTIPNDSIDKMVFKIKDYYGMHLREVDINQVYFNLTTELYNAKGDELLFEDYDRYGNTGNSMYDSNTPARLRMTVLYGIAALVGNVRVVCTCNLSERFIGWESKWGDAVGDFAPFGNLTVREVKQLGYELNVPEEFIEKKPDDGMCGKTDEEKFGFTYEELDSYILGENQKPEHLKEIKAMNKAAQHKLNSIPMFDEWKFDLEEEKKNSLNNTEDVE